MRERPIPFTAPMVRALIAGTKTQTRRIAKPVRHPDLGNIYTPGALVMEHEPRHVIERCCPYGRPGDRLWVKEAWRAPSSYDQLPPRQIPDHEGRRFIADEVTGPDPGYGKHRHGMFMPRWASRILLTISQVGLERLQHISGADARAEGCDHDDPCDHVRLSCAEIRCPGPDYRIGYRNLWERINGPGSWAANPWVWVVKFRVSEER